MSPLALSTLTTALALSVQNSSSGLSLFNESEYVSRLERWEAIASTLFVETAAQSTCNHDMRSTLPACTQLGSMWCWATATASFTEYYKASGPAQCHGLECQIVSWCPKPPHCSSSKAQCCPLDSHKECGADGATYTMIVEAATHFTGRKHSDHGGPMSQAELDAKLQAGKPIMMLVGAGASATHVVWVRGCGGGKYYFWDPEWSSSHGGVYPPGSDVRSYSELLTYKYPNGYVLKWLDTISA